MSIKSKLIFVYRADRGLYNAISHTMHRVFSPQTYECRLCFFTTSPFGKLREWKNYLNARPEKKTFYHRREFSIAYPNITDELPLILLQQAGETQPQPLLNRYDIESCSDLSELIQKLESALTSQVYAWRLVNTAPQ